MEFNWSRLDTAVQKYVNGRVEDLEEKARSLGGFTIDLYRVRYDLTYDAAAAQIRRMISKGILEVVWKGGVAGMSGGQRVIYRIVGQKP